jgi:hypothetical protein
MNLYGVNFFLLYLVLLVQESIYGMSNPFRPSGRMRRVDRDQVFLHDKVEKVTYRFMYMRLDHSSTVVTRFVLRVPPSLKIKNHQSH